MITIILGPDYGMAHAELQRLTREIDPSGQSTSTLDGQSTPIRTVMMDIASMGFFAEGRVVIVENLMARLGKPGAKDGANPPDWAGLFAAVPAENTLVLFDPSLASVPAGVKKALPEHARVTTSKPPRGPELLGWMQHQAQRAGGKMDQRAAQALANALFPQSWMHEPRNPAYDRPPDMELLGNEIRKLVLAAHPDAVTQQTVADMTPSEQDDHLFQFLDAAASGNLQVALPELEKLLLAGEDPAKLLAQLSQNIELGAVMAAAGRRSPADVGKAIGVANAGRMSAIQRGLQGQSPQSSWARVGITERADRRLKTGRLKDPVDQLYEVMLGIQALRQRRPRPGQ